MNSEKQANTIIEHLDELTEDDAEFSINKMWSLKRKLYSQNHEVPMGMKDETENLITNRTSLIKLYQNMYQKRLTHKQMMEGWNDVQELKEYLFQNPMFHSE